MSCVVAPHLNNDTIITIITPKNMGHISRPHQGRVSPNSSHATPGATCVSIADSDVTMYIDTLYIAIHAIVIIS